MRLAQQLVVLDRTDRRALCVEAGPATIEGSAVRVPAGTTQGFATYFNAFPLSYWVRWAAVSTVRLEVTAQGAGTVRVLRSGPDGVAGVVSTGPSGEPVEVRVADRPDAADGGWLWFEVDAGRDDLLITDVRWYVDAPARRDGDVCLHTTTMDKPEFCVATLERIAASKALRSEIDVMFVVDQGRRKVADHPGFAAVALSLGDQLVVIDQPNLGGSGGFSRGMYETLARPEATAVILLDDDVEVEPEALLRAIRFHRTSVEPVLVGGHMLDLNHPTALHALSEVVDQRHFMWGTRVREHERHDLARGTLRDTPWLHAREDADYNGWWMCLIPVDAIRAVGLSLPLFLKWDDAEFGLRAGKAGFRTVSLPGAALWHVDWTDKDDTVEWQALLHTRNRVIAALLHSSRPRGGALLRDLLATDLKLLLSMRYFPVELHVRALAEVFAGPGYLHAGLGDVVSSARSVGSDYRETTRHVAGDPVFDAALAARAPVSTTTGAASGPADKPATGGAQALFALRELARNLIPLRKTAARAPRRVVRREDATWWTVPRYGSLLVLSADGTVGTWLSRDPRLFWRLAAATLWAHVRLAVRWRSLAATWRGAAPGLSSPEIWQDTFGLDAR